MKKVTARLGSLGLPVHEHCDVKTWALHHYCDTVPKSLKRS